MVYDAIVVGGGIIGASSAYYLAKKDYKVALLDQGALANPAASSCDHVRIFRLTHGKDSFYTELARKALPIWNEFQQEAREELLQQIGMLELAVGKTTYEDQSARVLEELNIPHQKMKSKVVCDRYRMIKQRSFKYALYHSGAGMVWAKKAIAAFIRLGVRHGMHAESGAKIVRVMKNKSGVQGLKDGHGKTWKAKNYVFASGAWTNEVLKEFRLPVYVTRQEALYIRPPRNQGRYRPAHFPVFTVSSKGFYGVPVHIHGFMKIGSYKKGPIVRGVVTPIEPDKNFVRKTRSFLKTIIPDLCDFVDIEGKVYYYTRMPDGNFLLDRLGGLPNAWVAVGFSGHGPMLAPMIGQTVAQLVGGEKPDFNLQRFRFDRLRLRAK
ncbi:MAG: FAD-dependent oxidoreductase [Elusimicrobiota bacterium]